MKIAVCLSAQPRSIEYVVDSILNFFSDPMYEVDFFCHTWDYNTWKTKENNEIIFGKYEEVDVDWLTNQLQRFSPKKYKIGSYYDIHTKYEFLPWSSLFYSMAYSNMLKLEYEIENNFKYDYVVKSRYDVVFDPDRRFIPVRDRKERHLYFSHAGRMNYRYNYINASDPFFYGDSWGMDIIADAFTLIKQEFTTEFSGRHDQVFMHDPGTLISSIANRFNIIIDIDKNNPADVIFRKESSKLHWRNDFDEIVRIHSSYYE